MVNITFPDGAVRQYEKGTTALDIAKSISEGLARKVLAANINGQVWDATRPINEDASMDLLTWNDAEGKSTFWHSSAHLMAEAVESLFPNVKFWVGPPVENGFYYDMDLGDRKMTEEDLAKLEKKSATAESKARPGTTATFSPDGKTIFTQDGKALRVWQGSQSSPQVGPAQVPSIPVPTAPAKQVPPGWKTKEFNGMTYYMVPLAEHSAR